MSDIKTWKYHISSSEQFKEGELIALTDRGLDTLSFPDEFSSTTDDNGNVIIVYRKKDGSIWSVTFDKNQEDVLEHEQLLYVPSGSSNPSVAMDKDGKKIIAIEFLPAGATQKEIWVYEYPYSGSGIRRIGSGQHPYLANDKDGEIFLFMQTADLQKIVYWKKSEDFSQRHDMPENDLEEPYPVGFRTSLKRYNNYLEYQYAFFSKSEDAELPRYMLTDKIISLNLLKEKAEADLSISLFDLHEYAFNITATFIDMFHGTPIEGAEVKFRDKVFITDSNGTIDIGKVGGYPNDEFELSHPDYSREVFGIQIREDRDYVFEVMGDLVVVDTAKAGIEVGGIEWESMLKPLSLIIYDGYNFIEGATVEMAGSTVVTDENGRAQFYDMRANDVHEYIITHPDYECPTVGKVMVPEDDNIDEVLTQIFPYPPNIISDVAEANLSIDGITWIDMRYTVIIQLLDGISGQEIQGADIEFNNEIKTSDSEGKAIFKKVIPYPTVDYYNVKVNEKIEARVRITGYDVEKEVLIPIQVGAEITPLELKDEVEAGLNINSILWVEV